MQYLKSRPDDSQSADSLRFLLAAMNALKRRNPLTESFLVQLDVDLEALGMRIPKLRAAFPRSTDSVCRIRTRRVSLCGILILTLRSRFRRTRPRPARMRYGPAKTLMGSWRTKTSATSSGHKKTTRIRRMHLISSNPRAKTRIARVPDRIKPVSRPPKAGRASNKWRRRGTLGRRRTCR